MNTSETTVEIPGVVLATMADGRVTRIVFMPHGDYAGPRSVCAVVQDGDWSLDVESTDGPFWRAVQDHLSGSGETIRWEE